MSATLGNLPEAMAALLPADRASDGVQVQGKVPKSITIDTLIPPTPQRFPWAGHMGMSMLPAVVDEIAQHSNTLIF
ncbi:hypothetical protein, partial [Salmonella enterica]|uniref:hypothetical protein n=1 Tax=Salmonella enterica TaxID=28901 RepID=UPI0020C277A2